MPLANENNTTQFKISDLITDWRNLSGFKEYLSNSLFILSKILTSYKKHKSVFTYRN